MDLEHITYDVADGIATITLRRPDRLNAFTGRMAADLLGAFEESDADDAVRAVIVTGAGRAFCAGADLEAGGETFRARDTAAGSAHRDTGGRVSLRIFASHKPVIAAVNGAAVGVGATMTLPMDVRIAAESARFGFVFTRRGIVPEAASSWFLPRAVGISTALEWTMTGRVFGAAEALERGLVSRVVPDAELLDAARSLAREIAENTAPVSVAMTRQMLWRMLGAAHPMDAHRLDSRAMELRGAAGDVREGVASFLEKRPARFPDRVSADLPDLGELLGPDPAF